MSSDVGVGHWLGHSLHEGSWGSLNNRSSHWGSVWKVVVVVEVIVSEWVSIGIVASSVGSVGTVSVVAQAVIAQSVAVVKSISISL